MSAISVQQSSAIPHIQPAWRQVGVAVTDSKNASDALARADLAWEVNELPVELSMPFADNRLIRSHKAIVRADTNDLLGVVGSRYQPIQNRQAFQFLDSLLQENSLTFETAGDLHGGRIVWMLVRMPQQLRIIGTDDVTDPYLLCVNSHDGTKAFRVLTTMIRVSCQNTLTAALRQGSGSGLSLRHLPTALDRINEARQTLGLAVRQFGRMNMEMNRLARVRITDEQAKQYFKLVWPDDPQAEDTTRAEATREQLLGNFYKEGESFRSIGGTAWAAVNAVTHYADYQRPSRGPSDHRRLHNRLESIWFGDSASVKRRAWDEALYLVSN